MFFCMHWEVGKKIQMPSVKRDIKMWFRGSFHLLCDSARILVSANDLWSALFMWKMYQNFVCEMFWFLFVNSDFPTCSPDDRKTSVQWESVTSSIQKTFSQLTLGLYGTERLCCLLEIHFLFHIHLWSNLQASKNNQLSFQTYLYLEDTKKMQIQRRVHSSETKTRKEGSGMQP